MLRQRRINPGALVPVLLLAATGCGGASGTVSGKVTYQSKPVSAGTVMFLHETRGAFSSTIKDDGSYQIANVPSGSVKIAVVPPNTPITKRWHGSVGEVDLTKAEEGQPKISKEALKEKMGLQPAAKTKPIHLPDKYGNPEESGKTYTVIAGPQTHDITLD